VNVHCEREASLAKKRNDGLLLMLAGAIFFLVVGFAWSRSTPIAMGDFKVVYYSARCLLQNGDPYNSSEVMKIYDGEGRELPSMSERSREVITRFFYPPTAFIVTIPFALLGFAAGHLLWMVLSGGGLFVAAILAWDLSRDLAPVVSGALLGFLLMNSFWLLMIGNSAAIAISLCVMAVWCFLRDRFVWAGVVLLALSLALKPHDAGCVWLFFLLAGGTFRKRALQTLTILVVLSLPAFLWVMRVSPQWIQEIRQNAETFSAVGGITDPGIAGMAGRNMDSVVELQSAVSVLYGNPHTYNLITYLICGALLLVWAIATLRYRPTGAKSWIALAAVVPLSMLPVYHLQHDAKLLILAIPACAWLSSQRGTIGWLAILVTGAGIGINGDIFSALRIALTHRFLVPEPNLVSKIVAVLLTRPGPILLLVMSMFYLWVYVRNRFEGPRRSEVLNEMAHREEGLSMRSL
jgi:hypothetical protein